MVGMSKSHSPMNHSERQLLHPFDVFPNRVHMKNASNDLTDVYWAADENTLSWLMPFTSENHCATSLASK